MTLTTAPWHHGQHSQMNVKLNVLNPSIDIWMNYISRPCSNSMTQHSPLDVGAETPSKQSSLHIFSIILLFKWLYKQTHYTNYYGGSTTFLNKECRSVNGPKCLGLISHLPLWALLDLRSRFQWLKIVGYKLNIRNSNFFGHLDI